MSYCEVELLVGLARCLEEADLPHVDDRGGDEVHVARRTRDAALEGLVRVRVRVRLGIRVRVRARD